MSRKNKIDQDGFMLAEVVIVVFLVGLTLSSVLLLEHVAIKSVKRFSDKINGLIVFDNCYYKGSVFFGRNVLDRDKKVKESVEQEAKKSDMSISYTLKKVKSGKLVQSTSGLNSMTLENNKKDESGRLSCLVYDLDNNVEEK